MDLKRNEVLRMAGTTPTKQRAKRSLSRGIRSNWVRQKLNYSSSSGNESGKGEDFELVTKNDL